LNGLTAEDARSRLTQVGPNQLPEKSSDGLLLIFSRQFRSPFIYVLFAAALVSFVLDQTLNAIFIFIVLLINAAIGTVQEYSAQRAANALKKMVPQFSTVIRDGVTQRIEATNLVPDDIVLLVSGDKVPADLKLQQCQELLINESALTGESLAAIKQCKIDTAENKPLSEKSNYAFAGTIVVHGRAQGVVIGTGEKTEIGKIAHQIGASAGIKPPLLQRIERFTLRVSYSVLVVIAILFLVTLIRGADITQIFFLGVALAVSAIPEGLPAAITVALSIGMRRMARANVITRKLIAVESLGSCTYIASDKTGTLTVNEMTVKSIVLPGGVAFNVAGEGMDMHGRLYRQESGEVLADTHSPEILKELVLTGLLANEATLVFRKDEWVGNGDGVDLAFLVLAAKSGIDHQRIGDSFPLLNRVPYEPENAYSASINRVGENVRISVKGSAEHILSMCSTQESGIPLNRSAIEAQLKALAKQGYRVLALATGTVASEMYKPESELKDLTFLGLVGMIDPLRPEAKDAITQCHNANIEVAMITGDHPQTAFALAQQLGIATADSAPVTGSQLQQAEEEGGDALRQLIMSTRVFARVEPIQKLKIVQQLIALGHFVAVTGDGVNDAPALRHAHVGIAMGKRGTDVAKESADLIITDDNFASIVEGIKQGRVVYNNIRKVIFLLISTGAAEIFLFILSVASGLPIPLFPIQLLWLNLVTNGIQDVALAFEPEEGNELKQSPRSPNETIFNRLMLERVLINAAVMGSIAFAVFAWQIHQGVAVEYARNITLLLMVLFENVHVFNSRSETQSIFRQRFFSNPLLIFGMLAAQGIHIAALYMPGLSSVLQVEPVTLQQWSSLLCIALILIVVDEWHKASLRNKDFAVVGPE